MSTPIPSPNPSTASAPLTAPVAPFAPVPAGLGNNAAMAFSQILTDRLFNQPTSSADTSLLDQPFGSDLTGLSGLNTGLGLGTSSAASSSSMMETLMALSLVMI